MEPTELRIPVAGGHLAVRDYGGTGHHVILVHNVGDNVTQWDHLAPLLATNAHVLAIDLRGHGQTTADLHELVAIGDDFAALADACDLERYVLVGHQWGGGLCSLAARLTPERTEAICVIDSPLTLPAATYKDLMDHVAQDLVIDSVTDRLALGHTGYGPVQLGNFIDATAAIIAHDWLTPPMAAEEAVAVVERSIRHGPGELWTRVPTRETLVAYVRGRVEGTPFGRHALTEHVCPVWVLQPADGDFTTGFPEFTRIAATRPGWAAKVVPGNSYCSFTYPEAVADVLATLLSGLERRP